jgi:hypothetical protein
MIAGPVTTPATIPDADPTTAIEGLLLLHVPPDGNAPNVVVPPPAHTWFTPVILPGREFTVTILVIAQPVGNV